MRTLPGIVAICLFMIFTNNLKSQQDCYTEPEGGSCGPWTSVTVTRSFPVFTACNITVTYAYRECTDPICPDRKIIQYALGSIDIPDNCTGLMAQLFPGFPNNYGGVINYVYWNALVDAVFYTLGKEYLLASGLTIPNSIGEPPHCSGGAPTGCNNTLEIYYSQPKCRAYCVKIGPALPAGYRLASVTPIQCPSETSEACCEHRKYFCYCGGILQVTNIDTYTQGTCIVLPQDEPRSQCIPQAGYDTFYIDCDENCTSLE